MLPVCPGITSHYIFSRESGALGSRLTGAGWGGCVVSLVHEDNLEQFLDKMRTFYKDKPDVVVDEALFSSTPGGGAAVYFTE